MDGNEKVQLKYCMITANKSGETRHPQIVMRNLGYELIQSVPQTMGDCWWFTVDKLIKPLPVFLEEIQYDFDYWNE